MGNVRFRLDAGTKLLNLIEPVNGRGGYQNLLRTLRPLVKTNGSITLDDETLGRVVRMCAYGSGGFQGRIACSISAVS